MLPNPSRGWAAIKGYKLRFISFDCRKVKNLTGGHPKTSNSKATRRALLTSVLALVMCVSMLIGTTAAWFTDTVTSSGNKVVSGTLKVDLQVLEDDNSGWTSVKDSKAPIFDYDNWEPGYVQVKILKVVNIGSLAFKWQANLVTTEELGILADVIDVYVQEFASEPVTYPTDRNAINSWTKVGTRRDFVNALPVSTNGEIPANATKDASEILAIAFKMQETAGNEYQDQTLGMFDIQIVANQLTYEKDSFDTQYDKMATIDNEAELRAALADDVDLILLGASFELSDSIVIPAGKTVTIDLNGHYMTQQKAQTAAYAMIDNKGDLTIKDSVGSGKISYEDTSVYTADNGYASNTIRNTGVLTVLGGTIENTSSDNVKQNGYPHAIDAYPGSVTTIKGGTVKSVNYDSIRMFCNSSTVLTKLEITGGTIYNRVTFQNPNNNTNTPGLGELNISGGNFVTTDGIAANVRLLQFSKDASLMKATITGGTFDKGIGVSNYSGVAVTDAWMSVTGGTFGVDPTDFVANGYKAVAVGNNFEVIADTTNYAAVSTAAELQAALDNAANVNLIVLTADITGDVVAKQISNLAITIDGDGHKYAGVILIDGNSAQEATSSITLKNINFVADSISADACVQLGNGETWTRYASNVTVEKCTFDVPDAVGIKSYTGGDKNVKIINCTATERAHSLAQLKGVLGVTVEGCTVNSVRGINFNNSLDVTVKKSTFDVQKYAVRFGADANTTVENYEIIDCTMISDCLDGDAVIVLRAGALNANLTITNSTYIGPIPTAGFDNANVVIK